MINKIIIVSLKKCKTAGAKNKKNYKMHIGGSVLGDHCSPLSDTTVLSSTGSASDHIDHVQTQLPYALCCGALAIIVYLIIGFTSL